MSAGSSKALWLFGVLSWGLVSAAWAQNEPTRQWIYCYGPQTAGRSAPPAKVYISGVSTVANVSGDSWQRLVLAYRGYVKQTYGADFEPYCTSALSDSAGRRQVAAIAAHRGSYYPASTEVVETGWVWSPSVADTAQPAPSKPKPGALEH